jgi:hypothetical protein
VNDHNAVGMPNLITMLLYLWWQWCLRWDFMSRKERIESLGIEVMKKDIMAVLSQPGDHRVGNRVIETLIVWVRQDHRDIQFQILLFSKTNRDCARRGC